jgi:hypothetical protein
MTQQHLIVPPPELLEQWIGEIWHEGTPVRVAQSDLHLATRAAQWGADQELEAICERLEYLGWHIAVEDIRDAHRPKPPSLKEQALNHFESFSATFETSGGDSDLIRRALESIPDPS